MTGEKGNTFSFAGLLVALVLAGFAGFGLYQHLQPQAKRAAIFDIEKPDNLVIAVKDLSAAQAAELNHSEALRFLKAPLDSDALVNLLLIANIRGDTAMNAKLVKLAADRSLRNSAAQFAAIQQSLARKNYQDVFFRFDGLIRTQLEQRPELYSMLSGLIKDKDASAALSKVIATSPPWRGEFMNQALGKLADSESAYRLLSNLKSNSAVPNAEELRVLIYRMLEEKKSDTAYFVWLDFLNDIELRKVKSIFDGGFELEAKNRFFDWTLGQQPNAVAGIAERAPGSADRALRVQFAGSTGFYGQVQQMTRLAPGHHKFQGQEKAQDLKTSGGINWKLYCYGNNQLLMKSKPLLTNTDWAAFEVPFDVPAENCPTQFLRLETAGTAALDMQVSGVVWFDDIAITSVSAQQDQDQQAEPDAQAGQDP